MKNLRKNARLQEKAPVIPELFRKEREKIKYLRELCGVWAPQNEL